MTIAQSPNESLRLAAMSLVRTDSDASVLQSIATIIKYSAEAEKAEVEARNASRGAANEAFRFYVPVIAPLVSAAAVVGALIFQTIQFRESTRLQRQTVEIQKQTVDVQSKSAEDAAWRDAIKTFSLSPSVMSGVTGSTLLTAYLSSGSHVEEARGLALSLLGDMQFFNIFNPQFKSAIKATPVDSTFEVLADLSFRQRETWSRWNAAANDIRGKPDPGLPTLVDPKGREFPNPLFAREQVGRQLKLICETAKAALDLNTKIPPATQTLGWTLWDCDLSHTNFSTIGLIGANVQGVNIEDADLSNIAEYSKSSWSNTAWWHAKGINKNLLKYLVENFPYSTKASYPDRETTESYASNVSRLNAAK